jgi:hypothetical protein
MEMYIENQMFYGFYPAVSTIGGEEKIGYSGWRRYFDANKRYERDRGLFKSAIPVIRRLNRAGWQPETLMRANVAQVWIERYGEPVVISCEIVTSAGKLLDGETVVNSFQWVRPGKITEETKTEMEWWNNDKIINAKDKAGEPMIEVRQGLVDRSKTPFWLVNNADYEAIQ